MSAFMGLLCKGYQDRLNGSCRICRGVFRHSHARGIRRGRHAGLPLRIPDRAGVTPRNAEQIGQSFQHTIQKVSCWVEEPHVSPYPVSQDPFPLPKPRLWPRLLPSTARQTVLRPLAQHPYAHKLRLAIATRLPAFRRQSLPGDAILRLFL